MGDEVVRYCLDTNAVSDILRKREAVMANFSFVMSGGIYIPSIVYYEIVRGFKSANSYHRLKEFYLLYESAKHNFLDRFGIETVERAADIYATLHKGQQIEDNDIYIAAIAIANDCTLVTSNTKHFSRIEGLRLANWRG